MKLLNDGAAAPRQMCPFSIKTVESSVLSPEGPSVGAAPCLGQDCMAYTQVTDQTGRVIGGDCRLCLAPTTLNAIAAQIAALRSEMKEAPRG